jgi:hypothetical protein
MTIINLTQHQPTPDQAAAGVFQPQNFEEIKSLLNFDEIPSEEALLFRAGRLADIACAEGAEGAMVGGAPFLMAPLAEALVARDIRPLFAFSKRESFEVTLPDGSVEKRSRFTHGGFVPHVRA